MFCFYALAAMSENRVIGNNGKVPWHLSDDFRWFRHMTVGRTVLMGRKTYESIGHPLPERKIIVLTRSAESIPGVEICPDVDLLVHRWEANNTFKQNFEGLVICGGSEVYRIFLPYCSGLYLTRVKQTIEGNAIFPTFENDYDLHQVIHETEEFRVESWLHKRNSGRLLFEPPPMEWPFPEPTS